MVASVRGLIQAGSSPYIVFYTKNPGIIARMKSEPNIDAFLKSCNKCIDQPNNNTICFDPETSARMFDIGSKPMDSLYTQFYSNF